MKTTLLFLLLPFLDLAQISSQIVDALNHNPIPFVNIWVKGSQIGTTSNENGTFTITAKQNDTLVFSAIGFQMLEYVAVKIKSSLEMKSSIERLDSVVIERPIYVTEQTFGKIKKQDYSYSLACGTKPWMVGSRLPFKPEYDATPFLKQINIAIRSQVKEAKFAIRLYSDHDSLFKLPLNDQPIYGYAKKGKGKTEIDLTQELIKFPEKGLVVVFEFLLIEQNRHDYKATDIGTKKKETKTSYEPSFGTRDDKVLSKSSVTYSSGKWWFKGSAFYEKPNTELAMELVITN